MKNWHFIKKLVIMVLVFLMGTSQFVIPAKAAENIFQWWPGLQNGQVPPEWDEWRREEEWWNQNSYGNWPTWEDLEYWEIPIVMEILQNWDNWDDWKRQEKLNSWKQRKWEEESKRQEEWRKQEEQRRQEQQQWQEEWRKQEEQKRQEQQQWQEEWWRQEEQKRQEEWQRQEEWRKQEEWRRQEERRKEEERKKQEEQKRKEATSFNLSFDLTRPRFGSVLAQKTLKSNNQPTDLTVTYAVPRVNPELQKILNEHNMQLLLVTCVENDSDKVWGDKGPDAVCYCFAMDDPCAKRVQVNFYANLNEDYGSLERLLAPKTAVYDSEKGENVFAYAFNFASDLRLDNSNPECWGQLGQNDARHFYFTPYANNSIFVSSNYFYVYDRNLLSDMEELIVDFRDMRGL